VNVRRRSDDGPRGRRRHRERRWIWERLYDNGWTVLYKAWTRTVVGRDESTRKEDGGARVWLYVCLDVGGRRSQVVRRINDSNETKMSPSCNVARIVRLVKADGYVVVVLRVREVFGTIEKVAR
jgi:predicted nucleic acid-binding Zn ribbon protein